MFAKAARAQGSAVFVLEVFGSSIASEAVIETKKFFFARCPSGVC